MEFGRLLESAGWLAFREIAIVKTPNVEATSQKLERSREESGGGGLDDVDDDDGLDDIRLYPAIFPKTLHRRNTPKVKR